MIQLLFPEKVKDGKQIKKTILVACGSKKQAHKSEAEYLYISSLFRKSRDYSRLSGQLWYILSAKHGLLKPNSIIEPYDLSLKRLSKKEQKHWAKKVLKGLNEVGIQGNVITFLAGQTYRKNLLPALLNRGYSIEIPLKGMPIGKQISWLTSHIDKTYSDLNRFYELISKLEVGLSGKLRLAECTGKLKWPRRGVYFFFEPREYRKGWPIKQRVVRVGTHAVSSGSKSTLWERIRAHKGYSDGRGNHRSSIFRLHVGKALTKLEHAEKSFPFWGKGMSASREIRSAEQLMEKKVTEYLSKMSLLWIDVDDLPGPLSDRAYIEQNAISLLGNFQNPFDPPSSNWLGIFSPKEDIKSSGLWNIQHVMEKYDPRFLDVFSTYIDVTLGRKPGPKKSIGPWRFLRYKKKSKGIQFGLDRWKIKNDKGLR